MIYIKFPVGKIGNIWLRRAVIVVTYPLMVIGTVICAAWNGALDFIRFQGQVARTAARQWRA